MWKSTNTEVGNILKSKRFSSIILRYFIFIIISVDPDEITCTNGHIQIQGKVHLRNSGTLGIT